MIISCFADEISPVFSDQLRVMGDLGIRYMDLRSCWDKCVLTLNRHQIMDIRDLAAERGIAVSCIATPIGKESIDSSPETAQEQLKLAAEYAHLCGSSYIRIFSYFTEEKNRAENRRIAAERLEVLARIAEDENVILVLESSPVTCCATGADTRMLLEKINSKNLRAVMDPAAYMSAGEDPYLDTYPQILPFISYFHAKDAMKGQKQRVVVGQGDAGVSNVLDALRGADGMFVSLEPHLAFAGPVGGFSGEGPFREAHAALTRMLYELEIPY